MGPGSSPFVGISVIVLGLLFAILFVAWCCKQCSQSKQTIAPLLLPQDSFYNRRYMTAVDVQTGLPVIIQTMGGNSRNLVRVTPVTSGSRQSLNPGCYTSTYGSIVPNRSERNEIMARTPPPPYSEMYLPRV